MLEKSIARVYNKFKLHLYGQVLRDPEDIEDALSPREIICMEVISVLRRPTVKRFAKYAKLSQPNAAYRVQQLVRKGYITKVQSQHDKREFRLCPTAKYRENYGSAMEYFDLVAERMRGRFSEEEIALFDRMLSTVATELMPEIRSLNRNRVSRPAGMNHAETPADAGRKGE